MTKSKGATRVEARSPKFRIACVEAATETIGRLCQGDRIVALTKGQFSMLDLIKAVMAQTGPADLVLSTWTLGIRDIENAAWLLTKGDIRSLRLLTDRSFVTRQPKYCRRMVEVFGSQAIRATRTHAKFAIIKNTDWNVCIRASMNLNRNQRWENFDLDVSPEICRFFEALVAELETLTPPGPRPGEDVVQDVFSRALEAATCGDRWTAEATEEERLAALGYTPTEIKARKKMVSSPYGVGRLRLADQLREATISAALGGDKDAREIVAEWVELQDK